jgi:serine phosphatase RsbU (regulator of sigma subunit)
MELQAVFNLFTLLFVFFTVPVAVKALSSRKVFVNLFKRLIVIVVLSFVYLLFQFLSRIRSGNEKVILTGLKFISLSWIIPFYISFLSQLSFRKIKKTVIFLFTLIPVSYTVLFITGQITLKISSGMYVFNASFEIFIIAFIFIFDLGLIALGAEIFILKSKREHSSLIFSLMLLTCAGITLDSLFFITGKSLNSIFLSLSLMILYLILSYKLVFKFLGVYEKISQNLNLRCELENALNENEFLLSDDLQERDDVAIASIKVSPSGGDFHVYHTIDEKSDFFVVGKINLKGVQGAFYTTMSKSYLNVFLHRDLSPSEILDNASHFLSGKDTTNPDISMFVCKRDKEKCEITLASAGHPNQLIYNSRMDKTLPVKLGGKKIGSVKDGDFEEKTYKFMPDDLLILFSEGFIKAFDSDIDRFDVDSIYDILKRKSLKDPARIVKSIIEEIKDINNFSELTEDVSVMVIKLG